MGGRGQASGCQERGRTRDLVVRLVEELLTGGWEEQAAGCQEEKKAWDLVMMMVVEHAAGHQEGGWSTGLRALSPSVQCGTNIQISEYIKISLDKYKHSSKYLLIFSRVNIFGYTFMIYLYLRIYLDIHSSNIYESELISNHCFPKWFFLVKNGSIWLNNNTQYKKLPKYSKTILGKLCYIRINYNILDKYVHLPKYLFIFSKAN